MSRHPHRRTPRSVVAWMLAALIPVGATAAADPRYLDQLSREAGTTPSSPPPTASDSPSDSEAAVAARLGVITPYGRKALERELRSLYPRAYRSYRKLSPDQSVALWEIYDQTGSTIKVLEELDTLTQP